eukprot:s1034_g14.t1
MRMRIRMPWRMKRPVQRHFRTRMSQLASSFFLGSADAEAALAAPFGVGDVAGRGIFLAAIFLLKPNSSFSPPSLSDALSGASEAEVSTSLCLAFMYFLTAFI